MAKFIKVNVGGVHFNLSEDAIKQSAYFRGMLNLSSSTSLEDDDHHKMDFSTDLIDRDQFHFAYILNCIRDPAYVDVEKLRSIRPELEYFQFEKLLEMIVEEDEEDDDAYKEPRILNPTGEGKFIKYNDFEYGIFDTRNRPHTWKDDSYMYPQS